MEAEMNFEEWWDRLSKDGLEKRTGVEMCRVIAHMAWAAARKTEEQKFFEPGFKLKDLVDRLFAAAKHSRQFGRANNSPLLNEAAIEIASLRTEKAALQAKIDSLMMEYCPSEMTAEQIEEWGKHQKSAGPEASAALDKALGIKRE